MEPIVVSIGYTKTMMRHLDSTDVAENPFSKI